MEPNDAQKKIALRIGEYFQENAKVLARLGLSGQLTITFPNGKYPLIGRIGIWLIQKAKGKIDTTFRLKES